VAFFLFGFIHFIGVESIELLHARLTQSMRQLSKGMLGDVFFELNPKSVHIPDFFTAGTNG
jgi:hypothetical protein